MFLRRLQRRTCPTLVWWVLMAWWWPSNYYLFGSSQMILWPLNWPLRHYCGFISLILRERRASRLHLFVYYYPSPKAALTKQSNEICKTDFTLGSRVLVNKTPFLCASEYILLCAIRYTFELLSCINNSGLKCFLLSDLDCNRIKRAKVRLFGPWQITWTKKSVNWS